MSIKHLITALILSLSIFAAGDALARPELTDEQLAKARGVAQAMNPPVDFDVMLDEADRLGVECTGDFARKVRIEICSDKVEIAQSKERQAKLREENARLDAESERLDEEAIRMINELSDKAEQKLKQTQ